MDKVYFLKDFKKLGTATEKLLKDFYPVGEEVVVKIHFGEPGNKTALFPKDVEPIIKALKSWQLKPVLTDTPVAYPSERSTVKGYKRAVKERDWDKLADFVICNDYKKVKTKDFTAEVCKKLIEVENVLVISHVKGHSCSGFGGAIKNLGMGGVSAKTKGVEHDLSKPKFVAECQGCGTCVSVCPAGAIKMVEGKAKINFSACWGCSICELECPYNCLAPKKATFDDLLAQGATAVINNFPKKTYYINIIKNITKLCDCEVDSGKLVAKDVGVLFSGNPVAIDKASIDLIAEKEGKDIFKQINHKDPLLHVNFASEYSDWDPSYKLIKT